MILSSLLPLIILIVIFVGVFLLIYRFRRLVTVKITHWLLLIFVGVLLLSMAITPLIIDGEIQDRERVSEEQANNLDHKIESALRSGEIEGIDPKYLVNEESFDRSQSKTLTIDSLSEYGPQIYVERKSNNDGVVESYIYTNRLIINGMEFTDKLGEPFQLKLNNDTLTIQPPMHKNISVSMIQNEFPIKQFTKEKYVGGSIRDGISALYLRIPANFEIIEGTDIYVNYVGE